MATVDKTSASKEQVSLDILCKERNIQTKITNFSSNKTLKMTTKRQSLQTLQLSARDSLNRYEIPVDKKKKGVKRSCEFNNEKSSLKRIKQHVGPITIFKDCVEENEKPPTEQNLDVIAEQLMVSEKVPESYWEEVAERRREALAETLKENEELHKKNEELCKENNDLKTENEKLSELASHTEYLASVLKTLTEDQESDYQDSEDETKKCTRDNLDYDNKHKSDVESSNVVCEDDTADSTGFDKVIDRSFLGTEEEANSATESYKVIDKNVFDTKEEENSATELTKS